MFGYVCSAASSRVPCTIHRYMVNCLLKSKEMVMCLISLFYSIVSANDRCDRCQRTRNQLSPVIPFPTLIKIYYFSIYLRRLVHRLICQQIGINRRINTEWVPCIYLEKYCDRLEYTWKRTKQTMRRTATMKSLLLHQVTIKIKLWFFSIQGYNSQPQMDYESLSSGRNNK